MGGCFAIVQWRGCQLIGHLQGLGNLAPHVWFLQAVAAAAEQLVEAFAAVAIAAAADGASARADKNPHLG